MDSSPLYETVALYAGLLVLLAALVLYHARVQALKATLLRLRREIEQARYREERERERILSMLALAESLRQESQNFLARLERVAPHLGQPPEDGTKSKGAAPTA
jgi:hypothetical protein